MAIRGNGRTLGVLLTLVILLVGCGAKERPVTSPSQAASPSTPSNGETYSWSHCGNTSGRVLLTFDDWADGDPYRATRVGDYLKSRKIRAAFFLINKDAKRYPGIVATLRQQGHWVENHTYSHPRLTRLSDADVSWQIRNGVSGNRMRPSVRRFRLPGGQHRGESWLPHLHLDHR